GAEEDGAPRRHLLHHAVHAVGDDRQVGVDGVPHQLPTAVEEVDRPQHVVVDVLQEDHVVVLDPVDLLAQEGSHHLTQRDDPSPSVSRTVMIQVGATRMSTSWSSELYTTMEACVGYFSSLGRWWCSRTSSMARGWSENSCCRHCRSLSDGLATSTHNRWGSSTSLEMSSASNSRTWPFS